jgi:starch phosphorylase
LENEIIPLYYVDRSPEGLPLEWITRMKESIRTIAPMFNTRRMLMEYTRDLYLPAIRNPFPDIEERNSEIPT